MNFCKLISFLLDYPQDNSPALVQSLREVLEECHLPGEQTTALAEFIGQYSRTPLLDLQTLYEGLFDRGRAVSLHLFEHLHGESRDRGQAMVDLQQQYRAAGLEIGVRELPDYLPLYLEFLATQGEENACLGLQEIAPILAVLACRLDERKSPYAVLMHSLLTVSGAAVDMPGLRAQLAGGARDDTPEALDKVWEEEVVRFTAGAEVCTGNLHKPTAAQSREHQEFLSLNTAAHSSG